VLWLEDGAFSELESMAVDPVCGMAVDRSTATGVEIDGTQWWFCSTACRVDFETRHHSSPGEAS
jgi:putative ABC transport system ATP-binding protein